MARVLSEYRVLLVSYSVASLAWDFQKSAHVSSIVRTRHVTYVRTLPAGPICAMRYAPAARARRPRVSRSAGYRILIPDVTGRTRGGAIVSAIQCACAKRARHGGRGHRKLAGFVVLVIESY